MNTKPNAIPQILTGHTDTNWDTNTVYNDYHSPLAFMRAVESTRDSTNNEGKQLIDDGIAAYKAAKLDTNPTLYLDVSTKVKAALHARGFTTKLLYGDASFTSEKTGNLSKQRALMGKRDCYFKSQSLNDSKVFHDIYINLSYSWSVDDSTIQQNAYALFALLNELSRLVAIRVFVVNHTGHNPHNLCYSYCLKKFRQPINHAEFHFFVGASKRTFGWSTYHTLSPNDSGAEVGKPTNTVSIANFNLTEEIDTIWNKLFN